MVRAVLLCVLGLAAVGAAAAGGEEGRARRVVILNATDPYLPAFLALDNAVHDAVLRGSHQPVEFFAETLDMHRFPKAQIEADLVKLLRQKYRGLKVDVVVPAATIALEFARRHRDEIWPGAAVVFHSLPTDVLQQLQLGPRTIGVPVELAFGDTLDLALRLRPRTRQVAVVAGTADPDRRNLERVRLLFRGRTDGLEVQYLDGLTLAQIVDAVEALPADSVVLYLTMFRDSANMPLVPRDVLRRMAAVSPVPIFGVYETYLGNGIAAGSIANYAAQGRRAGELVARVLNGEDPAAIGVQAPVASGCIADWRQLRRWGIDESLLPPGCEVRFREVSAWERYRRQILLVLAVILVQSLLIVALALNHRRLRQAQTALLGEHRQRQRAETLAASLRDRLARFSKESSLGAVASGIAHEINQPLVAIQNYAQAGRRRLQGGAGDLSKLAELFAKIEGQAERAGAITRHVRSLVNNSEPQLSPVALVPVLQEVLQMLQPEFKSGGFGVALTTEAGLPAVLADPLPVQLVLVNLLQNAMQGVASDDCYDRQIAVDVSETADGKVQVSVTDRGPGVAPERLAEIFEPLYSEKSEGMGKGLAISRAIIEAHGGQLWYDPNPGGGAVFSFTLRTEAA